jgi:propanol-preferring alcohol dehydrogenase
MKAAIFRASLSPVARKQPLSLEEIEKPQAGAGQVLLRVRACGVCRTDLHIVDGDLSPLRDSVIPGHQIVGEVVEGGSAELPVGSRVGVSWMGGVDGVCS